jgi:hypothetical protein
MTDKRELTPEEVAEVNELIDAIERAMENLVTCDATAVFALSETLARVTLSHSAGQVVYEGHNPVESASRNIKAVMETVASSLDRAVGQFPETLLQMRKIKESTTALH